MKTILLIEDNTIVRETTAEILELANYRILMAENGKEGIEKALETKPDLVICDIMMPVLDGYSVLHIFNKNPQLAGIPFIFLTARTEQNDFRRGMALGADDYLTKPFEKSDLLDAIEGRLNRFSHHQPSQNRQGEGGPDRFQRNVRRVDTLQSLSLNRKVHTIRRKQCIYSEGDEPIRLYFVKVGQVKTVRRSREGKELITALYKPGDFFGYFALLEDNNYTDSAVALEDAELIYVPKDDFRQFLSSNPAVSEQFIRLLAGSVRDREEQLLRMAYNSLRKRVADTLADLHEQQPDGLIQLTRDDLAAKVGTATESLIRVVTEFKQNGIIEVLATVGIRVIKPDLLRQANW